MGSDTCPMGFRAGCYLGGKRYFVVKSGLILEDATENEMKNGRIDFYEIIRYAGQLMKCLTFFSDIILGYYSVRSF